MQEVVLASTSAYRAQLLSRILPTFTQTAPNCNETAFAGEKPAVLAARLALSKAQSLQPACPDAIIIGSDQVAAFDDQLLGKPGTAARAIEQLSQMQGREVTFHTALCVIDSNTGERHCTVDTTIAALRALNLEEIRRYVAHDKPLDCAGSFKVESAGISLFDSISSKDPTALVGLPLIALSRFLRSCGLDVP